MTSIETIIKNEGTAKRIGRERFVELVDEIKELILEQHEMVPLSGNKFNDYLGNYTTISASMIKNLINGHNRSVSKESLIELDTLRVQLKFKITRPPKKSFVKIEKGKTDLTVDVKQAGKVIDEIRYIIEGKNGYMPISNRHLDRFLGSELSIDEKTIYNYRNTDNRKVSVSNLKKIKDLKTRLETENIEFPSKYFHKTIDSQIAQEEIRKALKEANFKNNIEGYNYLDLKTGISHWTIKSFLTNAKELQKKKQRWLFDAAKEAIKNYKEKNLDELEPYLRTTYFAPGSVIRGLIKVYAKIKKTSATKICDEISEKTDPHISSEIIYHSYFKEKAHNVPKHRTRNVPRQVFDLLIDSINAKASVNNSTTMMSLLINYYAPMLVDKSGLLMKYAVGNLLEKNKLPIDHFSKELDELKNVKHYRDQNEYDIGDLIIHNEFGYGSVIATFGNRSKGKIRVNFLKEGEKLLVTGRKE